MTQGKEHLQVKRNGQRVNCVTQPTTLQLPQWDSSFVFVSFFKFDFDLGEGCKGRGWTRENREMNVIRTHDVRSTKNQEKLKKKKGLINCLMESYNSLSPKYLDSAIPNLGLSASTSSGLLCTIPSCSQDIAESYKAVFCFMVWAESQLCTVSGQSWSHFESIYNTAIGCLLQENAVSFTGISKSNWLRIAEHSNFSPCLAFGDSIL